jgi:hypothetical protein
MRRRTTCAHWTAARLTVAVAAGVVTLACTPPAAVRRYASSATLVTAKLPDASAAISASCVRAEAYRLRRTSGGWYGADSVRSACADRERALRDVGRVNRVLTSYLDALASLAGEKVTAIRPAAGALGAAIDDATDIDSLKVGAVTALARFAADHATAGYRRAELRAAIGSQNGNVQAVTSALHDILEQAFTSYLEGDDAAETGYYRSVLTESGGREPLGAILVRDSYDARHAELLERRDAVHSLAQAMLVVGRGHQRLYDGRDHLGGKELLASIVATARELDAAIAKMNKAF